MKAFVYWLSRTIFVLATILYVLVGARDAMVNLERRPSSIGEARLQGDALQLCLGAIALVALARFRRERQSSAKTRNRSAVIT